MKWFTRYISIGLPLWAILSLNYLVACEVMDDNTAPRIIYWVGIIFIILLSSFIAPKLYKN